MHQRAEQGVGDDVHRYSGLQAGDLMKSVQCITCLQTRAAA